MENLVKTIMNKNPDIPKIPEPNQLLEPKTELASNTMPTPQTNTVQNTIPNPEMNNKKDNEESGLKPDPVKAKVFESDNRQLNEMIQKIMASDMNEEQKLQLLTMIRNQLINPESGEKDKLSFLHQKYDPLQQFQKHQQMMSAYPYHMPNYQQPMMPPYQPMMPQYPQMMPQMMPMMGMQNNYQFDILKNKLDTIQMEMIDITRHLKDYTKRYMTAVREDDMEKLDVYIRD